MLLETRNVEEKWIEKRENVEKRTKVFLVAISGFGVTAEQLKGRRMDLRC